MGDDFEAAATDRHRLAAVVTGQRDRLVDAARAENFPATPAVRLLHLLRERRGAGADGGASQTLPVERHRIDFARDLVDFVVAVGDGQVGEGELGALQRMIVVGGLQFTQLLVVVVELIVGEVFPCCVLQQARAVRLQLLGGLGDEIFDVADALQGK